MKTCRVCREQIPKGVRFCPRCGTPWKSRAPGMAALLVLLAGAAAVVGHDLLKPGDSWVLHRILATPPAAAPADAPPSVLPEPPAIAKPEAPVPAAVDKPPEPAAGAPMPIAPPAVESPPVGPGPASVPPEAVARPSPGFAPPRTGTRVTVTLRTGAVMAGVLKKMTDHSIELEKDTLVLTLDRVQMAPDSRAKFFAADHADWLAKKEAAEAAASAAANESVSPSTAQPPRAPRSPTTTTRGGPRPAKRPPEPATPSVTNPAAGETRDAKDIFFDAFSK